MNTKQITDKLARFIKQSWIDNPMFEELTDDLMSSEGPCETLEGELLRAANRIVYRYYNDGDRVNEGYGIETAGPAYEFLFDHSGAIPGFEKELLKLTSGVESRIEEGMLEMVYILSYYVQQKKETGLTPNTEDMLDSKYKQQAIADFGQPDAGWDDEEDHWEEYDDLDENDDNSWH